MKVVVSSICNFTRKTLDPELNLPEKQEKERPCDVKGTNIMND